MGLPEPRHVKKITQKPQRLSIVLFFIVAVILAIVMPLRGSSQSPISFERFSEQMLKHHDVDHVTAYKSGDLFVAEIYLKRESMNKPEYADAEKEKSPVSLDGEGTLPQYVFTAATYDDLVKGYMMQKQDLAMPRPIKSPY